MADAKSYDLIVIGSGGHVDGATVARLLQSFKQFVETPEAMLL